MSIQTETAPNGGSSGPGLNGLQAISGSAAVNQSAGEPQPTAQPHHHNRDPYPQAYPPYSSIPVSYNPAYNPEVNIPTYYPHDASQPPHSDSHQGHRDQHQRPHQSIHSEPINHPALQQSESTAPATSTQGEGPNQSFTESSASVSKRRYGSTNGSEDETQLSRRQRPRLSTSGTHIDTDAELTKEDSEVGPSGGPKHWTDEEKARLFHWMLDDDERWEAFGTKMNTIFREGSVQLFNSRKSFTALKSCYHRNLEIFKQIYVLEAFLAKAGITPGQMEVAEPTASTSTNDSPLVSSDPTEVAAIPTPSSFTSATERQTFLDRKLEAAKALNIPVSNLTVKVIDHWFDMGWFALFKKRFQEDPKTGLPIPRYAADREGEDDAEGEEVHDDPEHAAPTSTVQADSTVADARHRHLDPMGCLIPSPFPNPMTNSRTPHSSHRSHRAITPPSAAGPSSTHQQLQHSQGSSHHSHSAHSSPQLPYGYPLHPTVHVFPPPTASAEYQAQQQQLHFHMQTVQSLTHLTSMTQTLLGTCNTLVELVRAQAEDIRVQTELLRRREEREETIGRQPVDGGSASQVNTRVENSDQLRIPNRAAAATEVLSNPQLTDDVKHAAAEYLKRLFQ